MRLVEESKKKRGELAADQGGRLMLEKRDNPKDSRRARRAAAGLPDRRIRFPFRGQDGSVSVYLEKPRGRRRKETSPNGRRRGGTSTNGCPMSRQVTRARHRMGSLVLGRREATTLYANGPAAWRVEASTRVWWVMPSQAPFVRGSP